MFFLFLGGHPSPHSLAKEEMQFQPLEEIGDPLGDPLGDPRDPPPEPQDRNSPLGTPPGDGDPQELWLLHPRDEPPV